jgi:FAD/FMN-containing dehydrogenase
MKRRAFVGASLSLAGAALLPLQLARANAFSRVRPGQPGWPVAEDWAKFGAAVGGRLAPVTMPDLSDPDACKLLGNPFYIADQPGLSESSGWLDAWRSSPSAYVVAAENLADVVAAVRFARAHNLRLVLKGRGHSFFGGSNAPDSLLLWTRRMDDVTVHDAFTPAGSRAAPVPAVSCGAGAMWLHAYQAVSVGAGRYVQGGGCTTVGVAGLVQGGGFGSFSKAFGSAAASLIEAQLVTADGKVRVVNQNQESDLFWALKGGGGGTFGVVTRLTMATHELPQNFGVVRLAVHAHSDDAFRRLLARFIDLYAANLFNPHWGEQVTAKPDNRLEVLMVFQGLTRDDADAAWKPLLDFLNDNSADYEGKDSFIAAALPARFFWDADAMRRVPGAIVSDPRPSAAPTDFWWTGDGETVGGFWNAYSSAWMPAKLLVAENRGGLVDAWFAASRLWPVAFHFNKGLGGAPESAIAASRETSTNPDMLDAFALAIIAMAGAPAFPGMPEPNLVLARFFAGRVQASMKALRVAAPDTGAYVNECDYFQENWQRAFWGPNYSRLARIKRRYDPDGLFTVHHGVGSEAWSADGFVRLP